MPDSDPTGGNNVGVPSNPAKQPVMIAGRPFDPGLLRTARVGAFVGVWVIAVFAAALATHAYAFTDLGPVGFDAHAYWVAGRTSSPYDAPPESVDAFLYSPAFQQAVTPLALLPFPVFYGMWALLEGVAFAWLLRPLGWRWGVPCWLLCVPELLVGNVIGFIAVCIVLGLRRPELWILPLLTKITGGLLGATWFAVRGEWRHLGRYALTALTVVGVSYAVAPGLWSDWVHFLRESGDGGYGLLVRFGVAAVLVIFAARTDRAWMLAPAVLLATPVIGGNSVIAFLAAVPRLVAGRVDARRDDLVEPPLDDK